MNDDYSQKHRYLNSLPSVNMKSFQLLLTQNHRSISKDFHKSPSNHFRISNQKKNKKTKAKSTKKIPMLTINHSKVKSCVMINPQNKYSFVPNIKRLKHFNSNMIDSMLTIEAYSKSEQIPRKTHKMFTSKPIILKKSPPKELKSVDSIEIIKDFEEGSNLYMLQKNKLAIANLNMSRRSTIFNSRNSIGNSGMNNQTLTQLATPSLKLGSMMDRFLLKLINPDDCIEDYIAAHPQSDKFKRFKKKLKNEKERISKIFTDTKQSRHSNDQILRLYTAKLRKKVY